VAPRVAEVLLGPEKEALAELTAELGREIEVRAVPGVHQEQFEVIALDAGPRVDFPLPWLGTSAEPAPEQAPASAPEPPPSEPAVAPIEAAAEPAEEAPSPRSAAIEPLSPLDLQPEADDGAVDGGIRFPILPRPEQGEES